MSEETKEEAKPAAHKRKDVEERELQERIILAGDYETYAKDGWKKVELKDYDVKKQSDAFQKELNAGRMVMIRRTFVRKYQI